MNSQHQEMEYKKILNKLYMFKRESLMNTYLYKKYATIFSVFSLFEIIELVRRVILNENLYCPNNDRIIICNKDLEEVFQVTSFHIRELKFFVAKEIENFQQEKLHYRLSPTEISKIDDGSTFLFKKQVVELATEKQINKEIGKEQSVLQTLQDMLGERIGFLWTEFWNKRTHIPKEKLVNEVFTVRPEFDEVLKSVKYANNAKIVYTYQQIVNLTSKYILAKRNKLFDSRHVSICLSKDTPLGKALEVEAFHRCQVVQLIRDQLITTNMKTLEVIENIEVWKNNLQLIQNHDLRKRKIMEVYSESETEDDDVVETKISTTRLNTNSYSLTIMNEVIKEKNLLAKKYKNLEEKTIELENIVIKIPKPIKALSNKKIEEYKLDQKETEESSDNTDDNSSIEGEMEYDDENDPVALQWIDIMPSEEIFTHDVDIEIAAESMMNQPAAMQEFNAGELLGIMH